MQDELNLIDGDVTTRALGASGGDILINTINHDERLVLANRGIVLLSGDSDIATNSLGDGGNISIGGAGIIAFDDSDIIIRSQETRGGNITC